MSNYDDVRRKVRLILGQVNLGDHIYRYSEQERARERQRLARNPDDEPVLDLDDSSIVNEQVMLLKTLRGQCSELEFVSALSEEATAHNVSVVVHALIEVGRLWSALDLLETLRPRGDLSFAVAVWAALGEKLRREPHRFTEADLEVIDMSRGIEEKWLQMNWKRFSQDSSSLSP